MVQKGQFLERPTLIPVGTPPVVMEGMAHRGTKHPPLLVVPPQPEFGSGMDHVVAAEVVWSAVRGGHPTLRFNHRGVGGSQGAHGQGSELVRDAEAALELARENSGAAQVAVLGLASGAATSLALAERHDSEIAGLVLVSPAVIGPEALSAVKQPLLVVLSEEERALRAQWSEAVQRLGGVLEIIPGTDASYRRGLPDVGRAVMHFLSQLSAI